MKRILIIGAAALAAFGCAEVRELTGKHNQNPYEKPFYAKYLVTGSPLDLQIQKDLEILRQNPKSAETHNELGTLLVQKGFPKDAEREFERAVNVDGKYYPAWYNLGLVRAARGDEMGSRRAFAKTIDLKPGHPAALFQLGLVEEKRHHMDRAVALYAKAYSINPSLLDVQVNPRVLDSKLTSLALLRMYGPEHTRASMQFQGVPNLPLSARTPSSQQAPSPQAQPQNILTPAAPVTDPSQHPAASTVAPAQQMPRRTSAPATQQQQRPQRRRRPTNPAVPENQPAPPPPAENPPS